MNLPNPTALQAPARPSPPLLGEVLLGAGVITTTQLEAALADQSSWGGRLGNNLVALGFITEETLAGAIARQLGLGTVDLDTTPTPAPEVTGLIPLSLCERHGLVPLAVRGQPGTMALACFDPTNEPAQREVRLATGLALELWVATASAVERAIRRAYYGEVLAAGATVRDPRFNVTHHGFATPRAAPGTAVSERLTALERQVALLTSAVDELRGSRS